MASGVCTCPCCQSLQVSSQIKVLQTQEPGNERDVECAQWHMVIMSQGDASLSKVRVNLHLAICKARFL